jgi:demethylmenaquinone methyltransferase / 2-methoxy-6-polyprenyl-1,4-benzoquinol methylase
MSQTDYYSDSQHNKAQVVQNMFDIVAPKYDRFNQILSLGLDSLWRKKAIKALYKGLPSEGTILDLGCGSGDLAGALYKDDKVIAGDFCYGMLKEAHTKFSNLNLMQSDAMALPLQTESLKGVISAFVVRNIADMQLAFDEVHRCLVEGGQFVILEFSVPKNPIMRFGFFTYLKIMFPIACMLFKGDNQAYQYLRKSIRSFGENVDVAAHLKKSGFNEVESTPIMSGGVMMYKAKKAS